jgi:hypothetical protein
VVADCSIECDVASCAEFSAVHNAMTRFPAAVVIDFDAVRDRKLNELTGRALQLPRYRRLMITVAMCQLLRDARRARPAAAADTLEEMRR